MRRIAVPLVLTMVALLMSASPALGSTRLSSELLRLSQMPTGWTVQPNTSSGGIGCLRKVFEPKGLRQTASATVIFAANSGLPEVIEKLATYAAPPTKGFAKVVGVLDACKKASGKSGGLKVTGTVGRMSFPKFGQESAAFEVTFSAAGTSENEDVLIARKGDVILGLTDGSIGSPSLSQFERFVREAVAKV